MVCAQASKTWSGDSRIRATDKANDSCSDDDRTCDTDGHPVLLDPREDALRRQLARQPAMAVDVDL